VIGAVSNRQSVALISLAFALFVGALVSTSAALRDEMRLLADTNLWLGAAPWALYLGIWAWIAFVAALFPLKSATKRWLAGIGIVYLCLTFGWTVHILLVEDTVGAGFALLSYPPVASVVMLPIILALVVWGNGWFAPKDSSDATYQNR
jgi:hypothetical protein